MSRFLQRCVGNMLGVYETLYMFIHPYLALLTETVAVFCMTSLLFCVTFVCETLLSCDAINVTLLTCDMFV